MHTRVVRCVRCTAKASGSWWLREGNRFYTQDLCAECGFRFAEELIHTYGTPLHIPPPHEDIAEAYNDKWASWIRRKRTEWREAAHV